MKERNLLRILAVVAVIYGVIYGAMQHNLVVRTAALAEQPVTVIVDAGHGGEDGGAVAADGTRESSINLAVSVRLEQILALCGMKPMMLRRDDSAVCADGNTVHDRKTSDLKQRVALVNGQRPAVLLSIHQNHFDEPKYDGAQVFYAASAGSKALAQRTQTILRQTLDPDNRRECKPAETVYLLEQANCTGILIECGFLSNPQEALRLQEPAYQTKIACAIGSALAQFLEEGKDVEI